MKTFLFAFSLLTLSFSAQAESDLQACVSERRNCTNQCFQLEGEGSQAACVAQCAGSEAQCAGKFGISKSEPFIRKKAEELEGLLEKFFGDIIPGLPENSPSSKQRDTATDT